MTETLATHRIPPVSGPQGEAPHGAAKRMGVTEMSKQVYRGVESDSDDKPKTDHHHEKGLKYRGSDLDGDQAEHDAKAAPSDHKKVYRGVEEGSENKKVYRGVESDGSEKPATDHHHEKGLKYRGSDLDGDQAEHDAKSVPAGHKKVYRGVEED